MHCPRRIVQFILQVLHRFIYNEKTIILCFWITIPIITLVCFRNLKQESQSALLISRLDTDSNLDNDRNEIPSNC